MAILSRLAWWFMCFGLSMLAPLLDWAKQETAFIVLHISGIVLFIIIVVALNFCTNNTLQKIGMPLWCKRSDVFFKSTVYPVSRLVIILIFTWAVTTLLKNMDFTIVYQIATFIGCFMERDLKEHHW